MIGFLKGVVIQKHPPVLILDVNGVGYELEAPMTTFYDLPESGETVHLHTHFVVREDAQLLFGFSRLAQRDLFRSLIKISGIGPKVGLAILSSLSPSDFQACVFGNDVDSLTQIPGIGRKTAQRILVELRDRFSTDTGLLNPEPSGTAEGGKADPVRDAVSALVALGYKPIEASRAIRIIHKDGASSEDLIRQALKSMSESAS